MKLYQIEGLEHQYRIDEITDDEGVALFNVCLNFRPLLKQLLSQNDTALIRSAPGHSPKKARELLSLQLQACNSYIAMWQRDALAEHLPNTKDHN